MRPRPLISILWLFALCSLLPAVARAQQVNVLVDAQTGALKRPDATTFKSANGIIDATTLIDTDNTLAANSDSVVASQKAIKAYVAANSTAAFSGLTGQPTDNANLSAALGAKLAVTTAASTYQPLSAALTGTTASFTTAQESKLSGIATGATTNSTDAQLRDRATHSGTQAISTVTGLQTALDAKQPLPTYAALASDALTLGHDNIIRTATLTGTMNLTLFNGGSAGDWRGLSFAISGTQLITTNFAVKRNGASTAANVSQLFTNTAVITIINVGGGVYEWWDNLYGTQDLPAGPLADGMTAVTQAPLDNSTKLATTAYTDQAVGVALASVGSGSFPVESLFPFPTASLANKPANSLTANGTNGTIDASTFPTASSTVTWLQMGYGAVAIPQVTNGIVAGTYTGSQNVGVASATSGASLYYTFGSSPTDPTTSDTLVSGTIPVTATGTLKVKGFKPLHTGSSLFSAAYTINPAFSYLYSDDLVYASTSDATTAGWVTNGGAPNWTYTTAPAPLGGFASSLSPQWGDSTKHTFAATGDVWVYIMMNVPSTPGASPQILAIGDGTNTLLKVSVTNTGFMSLGFGTTGAGSVDIANAVNTTYHLWVHYVKGTGSNANLTLYRSTTGTKGSALATVLAGTGTTDASTLSLKCSASGRVIFNKLRISATSIGDNPL